MTTRLVAKALYALLGVAFIAVSAAVLLLGTGLVPPAVADKALEFAQRDDRTVHLLQEFCTLLAFMGMVSLWCAWNYEKSRGLHWAMTVFWALFALVHWVDYKGTVHLGVGQAATTAPLLVFLIVGALRAKGSGG